MDSKSDGDGDSPVASSRYSSCGDSEFDRYCSANSAMGTPSVRSTGSLAFNDLLELQGFGSVDRGFEDRRIGFYGGNRSRELGIGTECSEFDGYEDGETGFEDRANSENRMIGFGRGRGGRECSEVDLYGNAVGGVFEDVGFRLSSEDNRMASQVDLYGREVGMECFDDMRVENFGSEDVSDVVGYRKSDFGKGSGSGESMKERECDGVDLYGSEVGMVCNDDMKFEDFGLRDKRDVGDGKADFCRGSGSRELKMGSGECGRMNLYGDKDCELIEDSVRGREALVVGNNWKTAFRRGSDSEESGLSTKFEDAEMYGNVVNEFNSDSAVGVRVGEVLNNDRGGVASDACSDGREAEQDEDGASSRYEHSDDENSMYNYGTDQEASDFSYLPKGTQYSQETKFENENPLSINTSVAFGSEDWNEFLQESGEGNLCFEVSNNFEEHREQNSSLRRHYVGSKLKGLNLSPNVSRMENVESTESVSAECTQLLDSDELADDTKISSMDQKDCMTSISSGVAGHARDKNDNREEHDRHSISKSSLLKIYRPGDGNGRDVSISTQQQCDLFSSFGNILEKEQVEVRHDTLMDTSKQDMSCSIEMDNVSGTSDGQNLQIESLKLHVDSLPDADAMVSKQSSGLAVSPESIDATTDEKFKPNLTLRTFDDQLENKSENSLATADLHDTHPAQMKAQNLETNEFYEDFVHELEEILLDSVDSPGSRRYTEGNRVAQSQLSLPSRDGGSSASTSGRDELLHVSHYPVRIDGVEVIGAKQKRGSVSFSERLVGVKEYTVYKIYVWSGNDQWEIERRYRDFYTLYRQLKAYFSHLGLCLPSPWSSIEKESRKLFGNVSPEVIAERSTLIQECLQSILHCRSLASPPDILSSFLSPQEWDPSSPASNIPAPHSTPFSGHANVRSIPTLGKTISLVVEIQPYKATKQMLESQHHTCAGCHKRLDDGKTLVQDIMQTFGWAKPRFCEYTGQLFCSSCHTNDTAVLPAKVLHHWDFTLYPVSQMAKSYLDSIYDKPMLCVSAVNPFLFSKVPALHQVVGIRKRIANMMPYVSCPYRRSINKGLGSRRYLLESNEFFALKDLIDLSKGVFAALPVMLETVSSKIQEHITEQCLVCCEKGVPCGARQFCSDPSSLIFPFQEGEIERCAACNLAFHKSCFKRLLNCTCGAYHGSDEATATQGVSRRTISEAGGPFNLLRGSGSGLSMRLLSGLFSTSEKSLKDDDHLISLGSLPSNPL